jgi:microcystin-dependent protein
MDEGTIGEIRGFAGTFNPRNWAFCEGQTLQIAQNQALFSIIGNVYGGNGQTTFMLPDLRGRIPVGVGQGTNLTEYWNLGETNGVESTTLAIANMPSHNHVATTSSLNVTGTATGSIVPKCCTEDGDQGTAVGNALASIAGGYVLPVDATGNMAPISANLALNGSVSGNVTIGNTGNSQAITNIQPSLAIHWIICLTGYYPMRD